MSSRTEAVGSLYNELRSKGMTAVQAASRVNQEFHTSLKHSTIRRYGTLAKRATTTRAVNTTRIGSEDTTGEADHTTSDIPPSTATVVDSLEDERPDAGTPDRIPQDASDVVGDTASGPVATAPHDQEPDTGKATAIPHHTRNVPHDLNFSDEDLDALTRIIEWWNTGGEQTVKRIEGVNVADLTARPTFEGPKFNSGIRINKRLLEAARAKCRTREEIRRTGGSLSALIEILLWAYLDNDPGFLASADEYKTK